MVKLDVLMNQRLQDMWQIIKGKGHMRKRKRMSENTSSHTCILVAMTLKFEMVPCHVRNLVVRTESNLYTVCVFFLTIHFKDVNLFVGHERDIKNAMQEL